VLFGAGAQVNVGGLVASTLDVGNHPGSTGARRFSGAGTGSIVNQGAITTANGGYVAFIGNRVSNKGAIAAPAGRMALGAGSDVTLSFAGSSLLGLQVNASTLDNLAANGGLIQARSVREVGGAIVLDGGQNSTTSNSGTLDASGRNAGEPGGTVKVLDVAGHRFRRYRAGENLPPPLDDDRKRRTAVGRGHRPGLERPGGLAREPVGRHISRRGAVDSGAAVLGPGLGNAEQGVLTYTHYGCGRRDPGTRIQAAYARTCGAGLDSDVLAVATTVVESSSMASRSWSLNCSEKRPLASRPAIHATSCPACLRSSLMCFIRRHINARARPCHMPCVSAQTNRTHAATTRGSPESSASATSRSACFASVARSDV
jgi:hypothetical protein